jgi:DNA repair protein SbcC/Rad50
MQIRKVHLVNIKNYEEAEFNFEPGVTAICGPNGAGKTTIIESIAWVIFDHLDYKREDFLRRGSRKGSVSVSFVSKLDGRDYTVFRDTGGSYYAYDPVLQVRIAQQKQEMTKWLCQQLGVEPGTDLSTLFRTTIGVPQGTFTFDFSQVPSKRKPVFDKILKVEEYIKSADELKELLRLIERRIDEIEKQIARDEGELNRYSDLVEVHSQTAQKLEQLRLQLQGIELEVQVAQIKVERLDSIKSKLDTLAAELQSVEITLVQKSERENSLGQELERSSRAAKLVAESLSGYETYQATSLRLQELEQNRSLRDQRRGSLSLAEQQRARLEADLNHHRETLTQIERDRTELESLASALAEQTELEQRRLEIQKKIAEKEQRERSLSKLGRELDQLRVVYTDNSKRIEEAEQYKDAAELVARLEVEKQELENQLHHFSLKLAEIKHKQQQLATAKEAKEKCRQECAATDARINKLRQESWRGTPLAELETGYRKVTEEAAKYRAIIERDELMLKEIEGGLCPLLSERCLNMKEGQMLDGYFTFQLGEYRARLSDSETVQSGLAVQLQQARASLSAQATLDTLIARREKLGLDLAAYDKQQRLIQVELDELGNESELLNEEKTYRARLPLHETELATARDQSLKYAQVEPLRTHLLDLKEEGVQKRKVYDAEKAHLAALASVVSEQAEIETRLVRLGNPRATIESLRRQIAREPQLKEELEKIEQSNRKLAGEIVDLQSELVKWAELDVELASTNILLSKTRADYDTYITNQDAATNLARLKNEMKILKSEISEVRQKQEQLRSEYTKVGEGFSIEEHVLSRSELEQAIRRATQLESEFKYTESNEAQLRAQLDILEEVRRRQADKISRRNKLGELQLLAEFIRECLKKAGPYITEAYLHTISIEANQLYRDISGNSLVSVRWENDYEIILEEDGRDRPFNNLSGGEQMAAALSVRLALLKEFSDLRFAFFDEPTTNMDDERRRNLAQQIGRIKDFEQLFIISHDDSFEGFTDRVIPVEKVKKQAEQK